MPSNRILSVEKLARECLIPDRHALRIRAVCFREGTSPENWDLQSSKIIWRDVNLVRHRCLPYLLPVADGQPSENQRALIGQTQSDSGLLHAGNPLHRRDAFIEQF